MIDTIIRFARLCRAAGLRVSISEVLDAIRHIERIDLADEEQFHAALKADFVKSRPDEERFEEIYNLYFNLLKTAAEMRHSRSLSQRLIEMVESLEAERDIDESDLFPGLPADLRAALLRELKDFLGVDLDEAEISFADISAQLQDRGPEGSADFVHEKNRTDVLRISDEERRSLEDLLAERLALHSGEGRGECGGSGIAVPVSLRKRRLGMDIGELPFTHLTEEESVEVHRAIERLARKLRDRVANRYRRKREGVVDIKNTLRLSIRYEGIPLEIKFRRRQPRKPKIVALCDVSYSVWQAVPFMLNILYSIQDCLSRVRSFVFIAGVTDVSETMKHHDILPAIDRVMADFKMESPRNAVYGDAGDNDPVDNDPEISDYGEALSHFSRDYLDILDQKTTLIILGDGRTNYLDPRPRLLEEIQQRCRRIIWLNPESQDMWGDADSAIEHYRPFCSEVRPCRNLNDLSGFISELVL